jgi:hypothetical protein
LHRTLEPEKITGMNGIFISLNPHSRIDMLNPDAMVLGGGVFVGD